MDRHRDRERGRGTQEKNRQIRYITFCKNYFIQSVFLLLLNKRKLSLQRGWKNKRSRIILEFQFEKVSVFGHKISQFLYTHIIIIILCGSVTNCYVNQGSCFIQVSSLSFRLLFVVIFICPTIFLWQTFYYAS